MKCRVWYNKNGDSGAGTRSRRYGNSMKKNLISTITISLFLILLILPTLLYAVIGENTEEALEEKRELTSFPKGFRNNWFKDFEAWYNDHAPYRISLITLQLETTQKYSAFYRGRILPGLSQLFTPDWYNDEYKKWTGLDLPYLAPMEDYLVNYGRDEWLFYTGDNSVGFYTGSNLLAPEDMEQWKDTFAAFRDLCEEKGIHLLYVITSNKEQVYPEYMASYRIKNLPKREQIIARYMAENDIPFIYLQPDMAANKDKYRVYFQQDSHWTVVGAFIGAMKVYETLGMPVTPLEDVTIINTEKTGGDLSNFSGFATTYPDYQLIYKPEISYTVESFNDGNIEIFHSDSPSEHDLILISDSMRDYNKDYYARDFRQSVVLFRHEYEDPIVTEAVLSLKEGDTLLFQVGERHDESVYNMTRYLLDLMQNEPPRQAEKTEPAGSQQGQ